MTTLDIPIERARILLTAIAEFADLPPAELEAISHPCRWYRYAAEEHIIRYQDTTNSAFFIIQGAIRVTYYAVSGREVILCDLSGGDMFGELTAIDGQARSANVVARSDALVAIMPASDFLDLLQSNPRISLAILKRLTRHVRRLTERVFDYSTLSVRDRIHVELLRLARPATAQNLSVISPAPTHADLANLVSTHREAVTRELSELTRCGLLQRKGHELHILDVTRLARMVEQARGI
ncbi:Crp/Fnr family transcriptional regulator [Nitrosovibrio sp. Nv17]|uniref:Crp/Fnr family transcriptional regulator n=1 Tax=Nitrosovibrio sp. Nv17 TaxID=1855339 RepID=UPI000908AED0|nr:Crp/Fnr family transcriptional regulator [Nitrosovibrio sp. Nv17]SFW31937.1 cAMP-binding domain of CRP or a regulatory subunit of cAMP-dependent protein kinases [Nitrosovibrio sp. Nv17]